MARRKYCGLCGHQLKPGEPTKFDTAHKTAIYHEACFWGKAAELGWSYLQQPGGIPPQGLHIPCARRDCKNGDLVLGRTQIWYEKSMEGYWPYHPACAPVADE